MSCGTGGDGDGACADWAGEWTFSSASCDGVTVSDFPADYTSAANCTAEMIITESATCEITVQSTFLPEAGGTTVDPGAVTCSAGCTVDQFRRRPTGPALYEHHFPFWHYLDDHHVGERPRWPPMDHSMSGWANPGYGPRC